MGMGGLKRCSGKGGNVIRKDGMPGDNIGAARYHGSSKMRGVCSGAMEVFEHGPRFPLPLEADKCRINIGMKEGHGTAGAEGPGTDIFGSNA